MAPPRSGDGRIVAEWRNEARVALRTARMTDPEANERWLSTLSHDPLHRYWSFTHEPGDPMPPSDNGLLAFGGLTYIEHENGHAEISLLVNPVMAGQGIGGAAVYLLLAEAFDRMRLATVFGEAYTCNPAIEFWRKMIERWSGGATIVPRRKWWDGRLHDAALFWFTEEAWRSALAQALGQVGDETLLRATSWSWPTS